MQGLNEKTVRKSYSLMKGKKKKKERRKKKIEDLSNLQFNDRVTSVSEGIILYVEKTWLSIFPDGLLIPREATSRRRAAIPPPRFQAASTEKRGFPLFKPRSLRSNKSLGQFKQLSASQSARAKTLRAFLGCLRNRIDRTVSRAVCSGKHKL